MNELETVSFAEVLMHLAQFRGEDTEAFKAFASSLLAWRPLARSRIGAQLAVAVALYLTATKEKDAIFRQLIDESEKRGGEEGRALLEEALRSLRALQPRR